MNLPRVVPASTTECSGRARKLCQAEPGPIFTVEVGEELRQRLSCAWLVRGLRWPMRSVHRPCGHSLVGSLPSALKGTSMKSKAKQLTSRHWNALSWLALSTALLTACNSDSATQGAGGAAGQAGSAGGGAGGSAGSSGGAGGSAGATGGSAGTTGGTGGTLESTRKCGDGAPCATDSSCELALIESGIRCACDPSGHFLCDSWAGGGAPPYPSCNSSTQAPCEHDNGYCVRSCDGAGACDITCEGDGPAPDPAAILECDLAYCVDQPYGGCSATDGACEYSIRCNGEGFEPTISGQCPE